MKLPTLALAGLLLPAASFGLKIFPQTVSAQQNLVCYVPPVLCSLNAADGPVRIEAVTAPLHGTLDTLTLQSGHSLYRGGGGLRLPWFRYTPATAGFTGRDSFQYRVITARETTAPATVRLVIYPPEPGNMTVLLVVNGNLKPQIQTELDRMKADLESEGYQARIVDYPHAISTTTTANRRALWDTLANEFRNPARFMAGAVLMGQLPTSNYGNTDDSPFWCMSLYWPDVQADTTLYGLMKNYYNKPGWDSLQWNFDATNALNIWVSRVQGSYRGYFAEWVPTELTAMKRYLDANHEYRRGITRFPHKAYLHMAFASARSLYAPDKYLQVWPTLVKDMTDTATPQRWFASASDFFDMNLHGNAAWYHAEAANAWRGVWIQDIYEEPLTTRVILTSACTSGDLAGIVNSQIFTKNGGCLIAAGNTPYAGAGINTLVCQGTGDKALQLLAAGERWGRVWIRAGGGLRNLCNMIHGDLSIRPKMGPDNALPVISAYTADRTSGVAPLTVNFTASAADPDAGGSVAAYEWFPSGWDGGLTDPLAGRTSTAQFTFTKPYRYKARVEAIDNYNARDRRLLDIAVAPNPAETLYVACYTPQPWHFAHMEFTDTLGHRQRHNQHFFPGTWGLVTRNAPAGNANYSPVKLRYTDSWREITRTTNDRVYRRYIMPADTFNPSIWYKVPLPNGTYSLMAGFADCRYDTSTPAKKLIKATMDIEIEGQVAATVCPADTAGRYGCVNVFRQAVVTDGELDFKIRTAAGSTDTAFLNCFAIFPGMVARAEKAQDVAGPAEPVVRPNPLNPSARITARLAVAGPLEVRIVDLSGRVVRTLFNGLRAAGPVTLAWNGNDDRGCPAASGLYILNFTSAGRTFQTRLVLMK